ncbi:MAG: hypothetical protein ACQEQV_07930 [Fibrobacterota bacterium]
MTTNHRIAVFAVFFFCTFLWATGSDGFAYRSLLREKAYFITGDKTVHTAEFWTLNFGIFDYSVDRKYPGEGTVAVEGSSNLSLLSSGYIEGSGYGDRGKMTVKPNFSIQVGDSLQKVETDSIDYIFMGGTRVHLKNGETHDLYLRIEQDENLVQPKQMLARTYYIKKPENSLKSKGTVERVIGFSYTREGVLRAYDAALKAFEQE